MCYDIKVSLERQLKIARQYGDPKVIQEIEKTLLPLLNPIEREYYQVSGFVHPEILVLKEGDGIVPNLEQWGLIPHWVKDRENANQIRNKTLNARSETIKEKPSYRDAVKHGKCVIPIDGFYEHAQIKGKKYPNFIYRRDERPILLAGLSSEWIDEETGEVINSFSIVTTRGSDWMRQNIPHEDDREVRMPLMLTEEGVREWITIEPDDSFEDYVRELSLLTHKIKLNAHTVRPIRGKQAIPNSEHANEPFSYPDLENTLFD